MVQPASPLPLPRDVVGRAGAALPGGDPGSALVRWEAGRPVVLLSGDVDLACAGQVRAVGRLLARWPHGARADAAGVTFMDVAGLRAVLHLAGPTRSVLLLRPSPPVLRLLEVLHGARNGLDVQRDPDVDDALLVTGVQGW